MLFLDRKKITMHIGFLILIWTLLFERSTHAFCPVGIKPTKRLLTCSIMKSDDSPIYYPATERIKESERVNMSEDDLLYELFLDQLSSKSAENYQEEENGYFETDDPQAYKGPFKFIPKSKETQVVEMPVALSHGVPVEAVYKKRLVFGNYESSTRNSNGAINGVVLRRANGELISVDVSQIISSWDSLSDDSPNTPNDWADVAIEALDILKNMSPRKSDLQELWKLVSRRSVSLPIDSFDISVYIFEEKKFKSWINPNDMSNDIAVRVPTAAQRYAAAILLFNDDFHFKRRPSTLHTGSSDTSVDLKYLEIVEGGYKVLDDGSVTFREGEVFASYLEQEKDFMFAGKSDVKAKAPFRAGCISRQLRSLEVYSLSPESLAPPAAVKHLLKKLRKTLSPSGAKDILKEINHVSKSVSGNSKPSSLPVTPWTVEEIEESKRLSEFILKRKQEINGIEASRSGKKGPFGKFDFRSSNDIHPVICIDNKRASFFDDAFSLSPETGEILIHVVDVMEHLRKSEVLLETAKERAFSLFMPSGSLHMLPFSILESMKLSANEPNEVITVAISIDENGSLLGFRVFPSIIGPVFPIDIATADEIFEGIGTKNVNEKAVSNRHGFTNALVDDILFCQKLISSVIEKNPWVDVHFSIKNLQEFNLDKRQGTYQKQDVEKTPANRMINALLTLYSNATCEYVKAKEFDIPVAWENRDRVDSALIRRFGTQPLRNWLAQVQQRQIRAAMKMELQLPRRECAMAVSHHNRKRKTLSSIESKGRNNISFEAFENYCQLIYESGQKDIILTAEGMGNGGSVRIKEFKISGILRDNVQQGEVVKVRVDKIAGDMKLVYLSKVLTS